ncbi:MAG: hypothetical protein AAF513_19805, partial [Pseudomonadota bacterium]
MWSRPKSVRSVTFLGLLVNRRNGSLPTKCFSNTAASVKSLESSGSPKERLAGHEGRGIGLWAKAATYLLQDGGEDTYQANRSLGLPDDS